MVKCKGGVKTVEGGALYATGGTFYDTAMIICKGGVEKFVPPCLCSGTMGTGL